MKNLFLAVLLLGAPSAYADEGMWTFNHFPKEVVNKKYGFEPSDKWLENVRLSSVRLAGGCSGSFVSANGLVLTNHHCAQGCISQLSSGNKNYFADGFYAKTQNEEVACPEIEINQLVEIGDVTPRMTAATKGLEGEKFIAAVRAETSKIEKECQAGSKANGAAVRCDVVSLYHGGMYNLYKYKRYQDVRLVFAPELGIASFGGDPDNFNFPRYDLDMSLLRVYDEGQPLATEHYFKWSQAGSKEGELTFVSGHPGGTDRQLTVAQLEYQRDYAMPDRLLAIAELRGVLTEFQKQSPEAKRISTDLLKGLENSYKVIRGRIAALLEPKLFQAKVAEEVALKAQIAKDPAKQQKYAKAFDNIAKATAELRDMRKEWTFIGGDNAFNSRLFRIARALLRGGEERAKPDEKRLDEYREASLPALTQRAFSKAPIYDDLEVVTLTFSLTKLREDLGADHPFVKKVLGSESPEELATRLVKGSKLKDVALRKKLWDGGVKAVQASDDPMIKLAKLVDADARAVRKKVEDNIESAIKRNGELLAQARFETQGLGQYPDATFTLRLSYGQVKGWQEKGAYVKPYTTIGGAFTRATGREPFKLPQTWLDKKSKLAADTPFNLVSTNDIIGGNSGSPMINKNAEIVGLVFDGNLGSMGGDYGFDESVNRTVAVDSRAIVEALAKVYNADRIVAELHGKAGGPAKTASRAAH